MARIGMAGIRHHPLHRRIIYSLALVGLVLAIGTVGFHLIEHYSYVNSFYFVSMLATAEGPATTPTTFIGKIFASVIAFVSVGAVIFAFAYIFGPFVAKVAGMGEKELRRGERVLSKDLKKYGKRL